MATDKAGYRNPPKHSRYKPGQSGNPKGRPKRKPNAVIDIIKDTLAAPIQYREQGRAKTITRAELGLRKLVDNAVRGDLAAAATVLRARTSAARLGDAGLETIEISNWLQDYAGQTAEQKTVAAAQNKDAAPDRD